MTPKDFVELFEDKIRRQNPVGQNHNIKEIKIQPGLQHETYEMTLRFGNKKTVHLSARSDNSLSISSVGFDSANIRPQEIELNNFDALTQIFASVGVTF